VLWLPPDANYNIRKEWLDDHFRKDTRLNFYIFLSENILTPEALKSMYRVHKTVNNINIRGKTFADICERVHIADIFLAKKRRKRQVCNQIISKLFLKILLR